MVRSDTAGPSATVWFSVWSSIRSFEPKKALMPFERPAVAEETFITPPRTPRVITAVVWSSSPVMSVTSPTAVSSWESWLLILSTVTCVLPRSGTTCSETSLMVSSVVEKIRASRKNIHASTSNATASATKSAPLASSTNTSKPYRTSKGLRPRTAIIQPPRSGGAPPRSSGVPAHHSAADHQVLFVKNCGLPGRDASYRLLQAHANLVTCFLDFARHRPAVVAHLHGFRL